MFVIGLTGSIAMGKLAHAAPDGYTIGIGHLGTNVVNGIIYKNLNYDLLADLVPIARLPSNPRRRRRRPWTTAARAGPRRRWSYPPHPHNCARQS